MRKMCRSRDLGFWGSICTHQSLLGGCWPFQTRGLDVRPVMLGRFVQQTLRSVWQAHGGAQGAKWIQCTHRLWRSARHLLGVDLLLQWNHEIV